MPDQTQPSRTTSLRTSEPFYVGYLKTPDPTLRFLRVALPALTLLVIGCGVLVAATAPRGGGGVWHSARAIEWTGVLRLDPYPRLVLDRDIVDAPADTDAPIAREGQSLMLVELGKFGVGRSEPRNLAGVADREVTVRGYWLERDDRRMIEIDTGADAIRLTDPAIVGTVPRARGVASAGMVRLTGEIVDFKCYLGAMRPGEGKGHRACAQLCVSGGIPPVLIADAGQAGIPGALSIVVVDRDGTPMNRPDAPIMSFIGEPVVIEGELYDWAGLPVLRVHTVSRTR